MENPQIIALVAIAISVISIGLVVANVFNLQTTLINLNTSVVEQSQTIKSLNQQQNVSQQVIEEQRKSILKMQDNIANLTTEIKLLEDRVTSLEKRLYQPYPEPMPQPQPSLGPCIQIPDNLTNAKLSESNIPTTGLVAEWNFENNALDTSGHGNNGINCGTTFVDGKIGQALSFGGTGIDRVPVSPTLNFGSTGSFSISAWVRTTQTNIGWIVEHRPNNDGVYAGYSLEGIGLTGDVGGRVRDNSGHDVLVITNPINDNHFHNIVFVVDRSTQTSKIYVDGNLQASASIASVGNIDQNTIGVDIGYTYSPNTPNGPFVGILDQIRIYNGALSSSDVQKLFNE